MVLKTVKEGVPKKGINERMVIGFDKNRIDSLLDIK